MCEPSNFADEWKAGQDLATRLIDVLGLPKHCISIEILLTAKEPPVVKAEAYLDVKNIEHSLISELKEFKLVPIDQTESYLWPAQKCRADELMAALPAFVDEANQVGEFHRLLYAFHLDTQRSYARFLAGDHSVLEPTSLEETFQALKSAIAEAAQNPDASGSVQKERLLCLLVLQALSRFLAQGRS